MLEGRAVSRRTLTHLDRCLSCRNCETTCPSGVQYGRLVDIGRELIEPRVERPWFERLQRWALRKLYPIPRASPRFAVRSDAAPLAAGSFKRKIPARHRASPSFHGRRRRMHERCWCLRAVFNLSWRPVSTLPPRSAGPAWHQLVSSQRGAGCCGAASHHTSGVTEGLDFSRRNIDAWWPDIEAGAEAIVMTASGCGGARERLRSSAPARFRLCRKGAACFGANPGYQRDSEQRGICRH